MKSSLSERNLFSNPDKIKNLLHWICLKTGKIFTRPKALKWSSYSWELIVTNKEVTREILPLCELAQVRLESAQTDCRCLIIQICGKPLEWIGDRQENASMLDGYTQLQWKKHLNFEYTFPYVFQIMTCHEVTLSFSLLMHKFREKFSEQLE